MQLAYKAAVLISCAQSHSMCTPAACMKCSCAQAKILRRCCMCTPAACVRCSCTPAHHACS